jgi:hypothetical protein
MASSPVDSQATSDQSSRKTKRKNTMLSYIFVFSDLPACPIGPATSMATHPEELRSDELSLPLLAHARKKG